MNPAFKPVIYAMNDAPSNKLPDLWRSAARVFSALGDEHRQRILLGFERDEQLNVGQIASASPLSRSAVSHHLKILREAGVLESRKVGKEVYFWVAREQIRETLQAVSSYLSENF